jgi:hypothetical protein
MGFKSPVNRMNIEEQKKLLTMKITTRSQLHDSEGVWEGRQKKTLHTLVNRRATDPYGRWWWAVIRTYRLPDSPRSFLSYRSPNQYHQC